MTASFGAVFLMLCLMQIKHMFADYYLQTPKMLSGRGEYFHVGRAQHAGVHVVGSAVVFILFGAPLLFILIVGLIEWVVHFNIDYAKASYSDKKQLEPKQAAFWRAAGLDQLMHQLTYIGMVWAWVTFAA